MDCFKVLVHERALDEDGKMLPLVQESLPFVEGGVHFHHGRGHIGGRLDRAARRSNPVLRGTEASRLRSIARYLRASPIPFMTKIAPPGKSYHVGGVFPMRRDPGPLESDVLGRPLGLSRVHAVDSSVFSTIPATNLTLTVMANAHRIAAECCALDAAAGEAGQCQVPA